MPNDTTTMTVTYGETALDFSKLPHASLMAMLRRGVTHYLGSEQASKVSTHFSPDADVPVEDTAEARTAFKSACVAKAIEALHNGTVGVSTRGPAVDPITTIVRQLAKKEVSDILSANGVKWPKKAEDVVETPDGSKYTGSQLIDRRIAREGERLNREAKKIADEQARKAAKAVAAAKEEGLTAL